MKKSYSVKIVICVTLFICGIINLKAQMVYLPDTNFRNELILKGYGSCISGDSIDSSCPLVINTARLNVSESNIYDLQGVQAFTNLNKLNCRVNHLVTLPSLPFSLDSLICDSNLITVLPSLPDSMVYLECSWNQLSTLPALPDSLVWFYCSYNQLTLLPVLPNTIGQMFCDHNQLTMLPALPNSLVIFVCESNQLTVLPTLPNSLLYISCGYNQLSALPSLPNSLFTLICWENQLTTLPTLPNSLNGLSCGYNQLTTLPSLNSLFSLDCENNQLTSLPPLPNSLNYLLCQSNPLLILPPLSSSLTTLDCSSDQLTVLPPLPNSLTWLKCFANQLTVLPTLPTSLNALFCNNNQLSSLPDDLPDSLNYFWCSNNPNLACLPRLKRVVYLDFSGTLINCLPNYGSVTNSNPPLNSVPLCNIYNDSNDCKIYSSISGKSYFDLNSNCLDDSTETLLQNMHIKLYKNGNLMQQTFTGGEGLYSFIVDSIFGIYKVTLDTSNIPLKVFCPSNDLYYDSILTNNSFAPDNDFAIRCKSGFDVGIQSIVATSRFRPAHHTPIRIEAGDMSCFYGVHCASGVSGSVMITLGGQITYVSPDSGAIAPSIISGDTLIYTIADFGTVNFFNDFNIVVVTDSFAVDGAAVCISVYVLPTAGDYNPDNNQILNYCGVCHTSLDPNEKEVNPVSEIDLTGNKWLTYTIRFQNTGTAEAEHVYIDDTLNTNLDLSTFQLLAYSHQSLVQILEGGIARFNFPNINLPDSNTNEPASHGYVQYKIKVKDNATVGTQINNTAYIYFDFNPPVVTNTTLNTVTNSVGIATINNDLQVSVFPNPTRSEFTVYCPQFTLGKKITLKLLDMFGKELLIESMRSSNCQLSTVDVPSGIYFLRIETADGVIVKKLVKE